MLCAVFLAVRVAFVAAGSCSTVFVAVFAAFAVLLLLRVLSGCQPLKSQSLPDFDLPKCFSLLILLFVLLCCCCVYLCCCLYNLLLLVRLVVCVLLLFFFVSACIVSRFFCCLFCFCCRFLGRRTLKNPPFPRLTFQNVKNNFTID